MFSSMKLGLCFHFLVHLYIIIVYNMVSSPKWKLEHHVTVKAWTQRIVLVCYCSTSGTWCSEIPLQLWYHVKVCVFLMHVSMHWAWCKQLFPPNSFAVTVESVSVRKLCPAVTHPYFYVYCVDKYLSLFIKKDKNKSLYAFHITDWNICWSKLWEHLIQWCVYTI